MIIKCKMCGGDIEFTPGATYGTCEYCGSISTIPKAEDDGQVNRYNRANHFRRQCEFDKALAAYEKILEQDENDAEAHWGAVISRFGIEYVEDPATKKRVPTCHRVQLNSILADLDYLAAVDNAPDAESRSIYKEEAQRIAAIQKEILSISENEKPYDVFICYKETDENNQRTRDSMLAQDVYYGLTEQGYKVFFSRITLEDKLGQQYEPYIFAALNSAKVMAVIGTKPEYFNAVWVKNEWSRYLALMAKDHKRLLIPCYRDIDPYDLPEELSNLQSQDMGKIGFMQDLLRGIKKVLSGAEKKEPTVKTATQQMVGNAGTSIIPLLKRAYIFLEDGSWIEANNYCEKVLDQDPENAGAYFGKLMAKYKVRKEESITALRTPIRNDGDYQKAIRFADAAQKATYEGYAKAIEDGIEYDRKDNIYENALYMKNRAKSESEYRQAESIFRTIIGHKDAAAQAKECAALAEKVVEQAEAKRKDNIYNRAAKDLKLDSVSVVEAAIKSFESIIDWKDSKQKIEECRKKIEELNCKAEADRKAAEKKATKKAAICAIIAIIILAAVLFVTVFQPAMKHRASAMKYEGPYALGEFLLAAGDYDEAIQAFKDAGDYSDVSEQIKECQYQKAGSLTAAGDYDGAYVIYSKLTGYKDVDSIIETDENIAAVKAQLKVRSTVTMGTYGGEAIEWLVLAEDGDSCVMITVKGLDGVCFNKNNSDGNEWESSYVRTWLNDTFYNTAFSEEEKAKIIQGPTDDNVWLLSVEEVMQYFTSAADRICYPTQTAKDNGAYTSEDGTCWWWLRSSSSDSSHAARVRYGGSVDTDGGLVKSTSGCVRPVVVVRLS